MTAIWGTGPLPGEARGGPLRRPGPPAVENQPPRGGPGQKGQDFHIVDLPAPLGPSRPMIRPLFQAQTTDIQDRPSL
jgi:hypothetical protein